MLAVVDDSSPPRRLVLGEDAYDVLDRTMSARMADIDRYRARGRATGFAGAEVRRIAGGTE